MDLQTYAPVILTGKILVARATNWLADLLTSLLPNTNGLICSINSFLIAYIDVYFLSPTVCGNFVGQIWRGSRLPFESRSAYFQGKLSVQSDKYHESPHLTCSFDCPLCILVLMPWEHVNFAGRCLPAWIGHGFWDDIVFDSLLTFVAGTYRV